MALLSLSIIITSIVIAVVFLVIREAQQTTNRYRHLSWVGVKAPSWWALIMARFANVLHLRGDYEAITEKV